MRNVPFDEHHGDLLYGSLPPSFRVEVLGRRAVLLSAVDTDQLHRLMATIRNGRCSIDYIEVAQTGKGYGRKWINWLERYALQLGVERMIGEAQHGSEGFWEKLGYALSSRGGNRRQHLSKDLTA